MNVAGIQCSKCKEVIDVFFESPHIWKNVVIELNRMGWSAVDTLAICPDCKK